jgi:selenocysteine-specific elongation factor
MVSGVGGIHVVCLVVAADEGIKPQTREHIDICRLLGVQQWVVALTKIDLVDAAREAAVRGEVAVALAALPHADAMPIAAEIVGVSSRTGHGLGELREALARALRQVAASSSQQVFRLPIDRVFSKKGIGTVITGTVHGVGCSVGDELMVNPTGLRLRVRGLQVHGAAVGRVVTGSRVAINVTGHGAAVAVDELHRGDVVYPTNGLLPSSIFDVFVHHVRDAKVALPSLSTVTLHHGTGYQDAKLQLIAIDELQPGHGCLAQLRFDAKQPLLMLPGDRFVIRGSRTIANHGRTLGGGEVLRVATSRYRRRNAVYADALANLLRSNSKQTTLSTRYDTELTFAGWQGIASLELAQRLGVATLDIDGMLGAQQVGRVLIANQMFGPIHMDIAAALQKVGYITLAEIRGRLVKASAEAHSAVLDFYRSNVNLVVTDDRVELRTTSTQPKIPTMSTIEQSLFAVLTAAKLETPRPSELAKSQRMTEAAVLSTLQSLAKRNLAVRIKPDYFVMTAVANELRTRLREHFAKQPLLTPSQWKEITGVSRKFAIPLIEYFDAEKVTLRVGDDRKLR